MSNQWQPVKARCSPATFAMLAKLQDASAAEALAYQKKLTCSLGSKDPKGYVGSWGPDKGALFPFSSSYTDPATNQTGTCYSNLQAIDADMWNSLPMNSGGVEMTKNSFCNLATVGESPDKQALAKISKELMETAAQIYTKIQNMEKETLVYYQQHNKINEQLQSKLTSYMYFYNQLMGLEKINSQPDITLGGQVTDAELKARAGYYQFLVWAVLAIILFSYTMHHLRR